MTAQQLAAAIQAARLRAYGCERHGIAERHCWMCIVESAGAPPMRAIRDILGTKVISKAKVPLPETRRNRTIEA